MSKIIFLFSATLVSISIFSFKNSHEPIKSITYEPGQIRWLTWEEAMQKSKVQKKKILVDVYTDWCGWCKKMDASTFRQPQIVKYVNDNYYAVKFNAEQKENIVFKGKTYSFVNNGRRGYHELVAEFTRGRLSYPTIVFLDENQGLIQPVPGFKSPDQFEQIITYFGRNEHTRTPWETYQKAYKPLPID